MCLPVPFFCMCYRLFIVPREEVDRIFVGQFRSYVVISSMLQLYILVYSLHSWYMQGACILLKSCMSHNVSNELP